MEQERRRHEDEERRQKDALRVERIRKQMDVWRLARDLRAYVADVRALVRCAGLDVPAGGNSEEELRWTLAYADRIDPLTDGPRGHGSRRGQTAPGTGLRFRSVNVLFLAAIG